MSNERVVLCGAALSRKGLEGIESINLDLWGRNRNLALRISDISRPMVMNIPGVFVDLLEIATYVYCADQVITRGGPGIQNAGAKWRRTLHFVLPVREPNVWSSREVYSTLRDTLGFLSEDEYDFEFTKLVDAPAVEQYLELDSAGDTGFGADEVILFSGGLDSLAGAIQECVIDKRRTALVSHRSNPKIDHRQRDLIRGLSHYCTETQLLHVPVWINKSEIRSREFTQRTRSFLYASLAATVARMFGLSRIRFYENGVTSLNLPISEQFIGTKASRTTHPRVLNGFAQLFSLLSGRSFEVQNPFLWKTKSETVAFIVDSGCVNLVRSTVSCTRTRHSTRLHTHCGKCSQCLDRRFATLACACEEHDPYEMYGVDLLTGAREPGEDRTMLESYARMPLEVKDMTEREFFFRFAEVSRVLPDIPGTPDSTATKIFDLYCRHSRQIRGVLQNGFKKYAKEILEGTLPDSCLMILALPENYKIFINLDASETQSIFWKCGKKWIVNFLGEKAFIDHSIGMDYIVRLLCHPGQEIHVFDMIHGRYNMLPATDLVGGNSLDEPERGFELTDKDTMREIRQRLKDIQEERSESESLGDTAKISRLDQDAEKIARYLGYSVGKGGRPRTAGSAVEKARQSVWVAVDRAIKAISKEHSSLGVHVKKNIKIGLICSYKPDSPIDWRT